MKKIFILSAILFLTFFCINACDNSSGSAPENRIAITKIYWDIENAPEDMWNANAYPKPSLLYNITIYYEGVISPDDISYVRVYLPNDEKTWWSIPPVFFKTENNFIGGQTLLWLSSNTKELPIGTFKAEIKLKNGIAATYKFTTNQPGSRDGGLSYVYASDDESSPFFANVSVPALKRPEVKSMTKSADTIEIKFTINDIRANSGWAWFYDSNNKYIGRIYQFLDSQTGTISSRLNNGTEYFTQGQENTLLIQASDLVDSNNIPVTKEAFNQISRCRIIVIDGKHLVDTGNFNTYDYKAFSKLF